MTGVVIITGASRGIGAATARAAGARGFPVCVNHRASAREAAAVAKDIEVAGGQVIVVQGDASHEQDVVELFETTVSELGPVAALVNNAGFSGPAGRRVEDIEAQTLHDVFNANVV